MVRTRDESQLNQDEMILQAVLLIRAKFPLEILCMNPYIIFAISSCCERVACCNEVSSLNHMASEAPRGHIGKSLVLMF